MLIRWSVPGCIWTSYSGQPIDPVFDSKVLGDRVKLWHVVEPGAEGHHHLFPDEETAHRYAEGVADCKVYPHTWKLEADRAHKIARNIQMKADAEEKYHAVHPAMAPAYNLKRGPAKQFPYQMNLRISDVEQAGLEKLSTATGEDRSEVIRRLIREATERDGDSHAPEN